MTSAIGTLMKRMSGALTVARMLYRRSYAIVPLSLNQLPEGQYDGIQGAAEFNDIVSDLIAFTRLSEEEVKQRLLRMGRTHFESEFHWCRPRSDSELLWFWRHTPGWLWGNAVHSYAKCLDVLTHGRILDYGAGVGCNTLELANRGLEIDFVEIAIIQAEFLNFRVMRRGLTNVHEIKPYHNGVLDPLNCVTQLYDAIVAMWVFEHIPDYHVAVRYLIDHLNPGGVIIESTPFAAAGAQTPIHLKGSMPMAEAMQGMQNLGNGVWKKV